MTVRVIASCFLLFLSLATSADALTGKVIKITDGDTLYVLDANYESCQGDAFFWRGLAHLY